MYMHGLTQEREYMLELIRSLTSDAGSPAYDYELKSEDGSLEVTIELPGCDPAKVSVETTKCGVSVKAERTVRGKVRKLERTFKLGREFDGSKLSAKYAHGVLTLSVPRHEEMKSRTVKVETA